MFQLIGAGLNLVGGVAKGIVAQGAHKKYAKELAGTEMNMPSAITEAEGIKKSNANANMAGYADMLAGADSSVGTTMQQAKQLSSSPSALLDALTTSSTNAEASKRQTMAQNAGYKDQQQDELSQFLSTVKAPAEQRINQFEIDKKLAVAREKMQATKALMEGIEGGIGGAMAGFGQGAQVDNMMAQTSAMENYWNTGSGETGGAGQQKTQYTEAGNNSPFKGYQQAYDSWLDLKTEWDKDRSGANRDNQVR